MFNNKKKRVLTVMVLFCLCLVGQLIAAEPDKQTKDSRLTAHIVMSHSEGFIGSWLAENKTGQLPATKVKKVEKDKQFFAAFLAKGLKGDHANRYRFDVDWKLYKPDGTVMFSEKSYARGSGPVPKTPIFSLAYPTLFIVLEKTDPPGTYKLEAVIRDKVTQASAVDVYQFDYSK